MSIRDIKNEARRNLHQAMRVPASYYAGGAAAPRLIHVRVHTKWLQQGDLKGTNLNYAETEDINPRIVFDRVEVPRPARSSLVIISGEEGYRIGQTEPPDGITITAVAAPATAADLDGKVLPGAL